jgi:hypothetical protein
MDSIGTYLALLPKASQQLSPHDSNLKMIPHGSSAASTLTPEASSSFICTAAANECREVALKLSELLMVSVGHP